MEIDNVIDELTARYAEIVREAGMAGINEMVSRHRLNESTTLGQMTDFLKRLNDLNTDYEGKVNFDLHSATPGAFLEYHRIDDKSWIPPHMRRQAPDWIPPQTEGEIA